MTIPPTQFTAHRKSWLGSSYELIDDKNHTIATITAPLLFSNSGIPITFSHRKACYRLRSQGHTSDSFQVDLINSDNVPVAKLVVKGDNQTIHSEGTVIEIRADAPKSGWLGGGLISYEFSVFENNQRLGEVSLADQRWYPTLKNWTRVISVEREVTDYVLVLLLWRSVVALDCMNEMSS